MYGSAPSRSRIWSASAQSSSSSQGTGNSTSGSQQMLASCTRASPRGRWWWTAAGTAVKIARTTKTC